MKITSKLINWYSKNKRKLPWRSSPEPYRVWLSEVILQQTRIDQGTPYYQRFIKSFPDIQSLAEADEAEVLKLWQGLGYYSRARNLHAAAKQVVDEFNGIFPENYQDLLRLKGVGSYSAAAIASICYSEAVPVLDGNVFRFLGRHFAIDLPIDNAEGKRHYFQLAASLMDHNIPGDYNQAMMEFGALVCTPKNPQCTDCPFESTCEARAENTVLNYPVKSRPVKVQTWHIHYFVMMNGQGVYLRQRPSKGIWANMYDFPSIDQQAPIDVSAVKRKSTEFGVLPHSWPAHPINMKHQLTHRQLNLHFWLCKANGAKKSDELILVRSEKDLKTMALPKPVERFIEQHIFQTKGKL